MWSLVLAGGREGLSPGRFCMATEKDQCVRYFQSGIQGMREGVQNKLMVLDGPKDSDAVNRDGLHGRQRSEDR